MVFDATALKIFGEGEWKVRKHGQEKRRTWRKLHLGVDDESQQVVCEEVSLVNVGDNEVLPTMLKKMGRRKVGKVTGDGAYDTQECYREIARKTQYHVYRRAATLDTGVETTRETTQLKP